MKASAKKPSRRTPAATSPMLSPPEFIPGSAHIAPREPIYLASQLASICDVDLKTIHNWCERSSEQSEAARLECFRTPGGHLRFRHSSVLRFLGRWGYPIPDALLRDRPHLLFVEPDERRRAQVIEALGLYRPGEEEMYLEGIVPPPPPATRPAAPGAERDATLGLFTNTLWYVHMWDDPYAALVAVGERTSVGATLDLAVLSVPMVGLDERAWIRTMRERLDTRAMRFALLASDDRPSTATNEPGVVGSVPFSQPDQLLLLLEDQSAQLMAALGDRTAGGLGSPGQRKRRAPIAPREPIFVASQVAKIWDVDLKTVHNWVERGDIEAFCTPGRHLRFRRRSLLHFLRRYNMAIPEELAAHRPRVFIVDPDVKTAKKLAAMLTDLFEVTVLHDPVGALAEIGAQCSGANLIDAVVATFPVEGLDDRRWVAALGRHPDTRYSRVIVVSLEDTHRKDWQDLGAIATVQRQSLEQVAPVLEKALGLSQ
ncbi:MAG: helix-turn-helix domain-containing protein [Deltaproteobacteria bacterium]